jgi:hypothetical protein
LYERVVQEAKTRYSGDWHRGTLACKSRWQLCHIKYGSF